MKEHRITLWLPLTLGLFLVACQAAASPSPTPLPPTNTPLPPPPTPVTDETKEPGCTVVSESLLPEPPADSPYESIHDHDWTQGPSNAPVKIIEYGDFQ